jgi:hypothetical protein
VSKEPLVLVSSKDARAIWTRLIRPIATGLGFKPGKTVMHGWIRESTPLRATFWLQISQFGFDKNTGGKFIVEFTASDKTRQTAMRERLWGLLDEVSRREVLRLNNEVVGSLPGPSEVILKALPEFLRETYLTSFKPVPSVPATNNDVWFRYATQADAELWGHFVSSRLSFAVTECERRLADLPTNTSSWFGTKASAVAGDE